MIPAGRRWSYGRGEADGSNVELRVAPPFGIDVVAMLAANRPIFETPRPAREDAAGYLAALRDRIAEIEAADADFRGEWAYLVLETYPSGGLPPSRAAR
jgi:hypothetical protein